MPLVRSVDENAGRVVYDYNPETCGYVSAFVWLPAGSDDRCSLVSSLAHRRQQGRMQASGGEASRR